MKSVRSLVVVALSGLAFAALFTAGSTTSASAFESEFMSGHDGGHAMSSDHDGGHHALSSDHDGGHHAF